MAHKPRQEFFVIETNRPLMKIVDFTKEPIYADLVDKEKTHKLPKTDSRIYPKAAHHLTFEMAVEQDMTGQKQLKESLFVVEPADERGRLYIPKDNPSLARKILETLRKIDKNVKLDPSGHILPEELPEEEQKRLKGGRPKKY